MQKATKSIFIASINDSMEDGAALSAFIHKINPEFQRYGISLLPMNWSDISLRIPLAGNRTEHSTMRSGNDLFVFLFGSQPDVRSKEEFGRALKILDAQIDNVRSANIMIYFRDVQGASTAYPEDNRQSFDEVIALDERVKFDLEQRCDSYTTQMELLLKFESELNRQLLPEMLKLAGNRQDFNSVSPSPTNDRVDDTPPVQRVEVFGSVKIEFVNLPDISSTTESGIGVKQGFTVTPNIMTASPPNTESLLRLSDFRHPEVAQALSDTDDFYDDDDYDFSMRGSIKEEDEFAKGAIIECNGPNGAVVEVVSTGAVVVEVISSDGVSVEGISATSDEPEYEHTEAESSLPAPGSPMRRVAASM